MIQKKVCMVGVFATGKTSLVQRFVHSLFSTKYHSTVGVKIDRKQVQVGTEQVNLLLWDIEGRTAEQEIPDSYLKGAHAVLYVADGTRRETFEQLFSLRDHVRSAAGDVPSIVALNKYDLKNQWVVAAADGKKLIDGGFHMLTTSAKTGEGVEDVLDAIIERVPPPAGDPDAPARALIFDSSYDQYRGVVAFVRVVDGRFSAREPLRAMALGTRFEAEELGFFAPTRRETGMLEAGEVGYVITGLKDVSRLRVGDTITSERRPASEPVPGYKDVKPMVFSGLFPTDSDDYPELRDALEKLKLNDAALFYEPETSQALGFGFRCGFLGLLHMEIVRERLEREFDLDLIVTAPNVAYRVKPPNGDWVEVHTPSDMPNEIEEVEEPYIKASIIVPKEYVGAVMELNNDRRGRFDHMEYLSEARVHLTYELPLAEIVLDYYDALKSRTRGYASFDYDIIGFRPGKLVRVDVLVGGEPVDALSLIIHRDSAYDRGRMLVERLREEIPRQHFDVAIQAAIGARVIARETVKARRKDVLAKCYGGDISRKRKLLERQKAGKKRMKQVGMVEVPQEAFLAVLNLNDEKKS